MIILGIETSCDETAIAIVEAGNDEVRVLSNVVSSQVKLHSKWGGVVPNLAAREHLRNIIPVLKLAFKKAVINPKDIDLITVTSGPGLIPALLIGVNVAKTLSYVWQKPLIGIHHIEGHIYANFINEIRKYQMPNVKCQKLSDNYKLEIKNSSIKFPILCLVVSGGHTQLVLMKKHLDYKIIGETQDDAAGEAFDKVARILGLGYPGGPAIAQKSRYWTLNVRDGHLVSIKNLPRPMINSNDFNFSFSGLKTSVLYETKKHSHILQNVRMLSGICYEFQQAAIDVLVSKTLKAAKKYRPKTIMLAGGVSANQELRKQLGKSIKLNLKNTRYQVPDTKYSIDNASMIASAAYFRWKKMNKNQRKKAFQNWKTLEADANLKL